MQLNSTGQRCSPLRIYWEAQFSPKQGWGQPGVQAHSFHTRMWLRPSCRLGSLPKACCLRGSGLCAISTIELKWLHSIEIVVCSYFTKTSLYWYKESGSSIQIPATSGRALILPYGSQPSCMGWDFQSVLEDPGSQILFVFSGVCEPGHNERSNLGFLRILYPSFASCHLLSWKTAFQALLVCCDVK